MIKITAASKVYEEIKKTLLKRLDNVYRQDNHMGGPWITHCEQKLKDITGRKHAFIVTSGTSAITIMCLALGIKQQDNVSVINYSIPSTVMPLKLLGAKLSFCDLNKFGQQDVSNIRPANKKAILTTGLYGDCHDHDQIKDLGIPILNDSAQCFLSKYKGIEATKFGDASIISFSYNKVVPVFGTYGAILTDRDDWAEKIKYIRKNGYVNNSQSTIEHIGIQAQPHPDKCVQLATSLDYVQKWQARRQEVAFTLREAFENIGLGMRQSPKYSHTNYHKFCIFVDDKIKFAHKLSKVGIEAHLHYTYNFSKNPLLSDNVNKKFPMTDFFIKHALTIPSHPWMTNKEIKKVIEGVKSCMNKKDYNIHP